MIEEDFRARLLAAPDLAGKVGSRIDWGLRPSALLPAITLTVVSAPVDYHYTGSSALRSTDIQTDVWGASVGSTVTVARLLPALIEPRAIVGGTRFERGFVSLDHDGGAEEATGGSIIFRRIMEFTIWHRPAN